MIPYETFLALYLSRLDEKTEVIIKGKKCKITNRKLIARRAVQDAMSGKANSYCAIRLVLGNGNEDEPVVPDHKLTITFVRPKPLKAADAIQWAQENYDPRKSGE